MDERDVKLIALVQQHHHIYDKNSNYFKDKTAVETAWKRIAVTMKTTEDDCQRRWCVLRNRYAKERREQDKNDTQRKPWPLMDTLSFLETHVKRRRSYRSISDMQEVIFERPASNDPLIISKPQKWEEIIIDDEEEEEYDEPETKNIQSDHSNTSSIEEVSLYKQPQLLNPPNMLPAPKIVSNTTNENNYNIEMNNTIENKISIDNKDVNTNSLDDSNMHFCLSLHESMQKIPKMFLTKAKIEILQVLDKYEYLK